CRLDRSFGPDHTGKIVIPLNPNGRVAEKPLALAPDGKLVLVAGAGDADDPSGPMDSLIVRLNADGTFDGGFGDGGSVRRIYFAPRENPHAVTVGPDGRILVSIGGFDGLFGQAFVRLLDNGDLDPSFGVGGLVPPITGGRPPANYTDLH